ncbi:trans-2-enoyl-reductase [Plasmopara halstedii]|uniref:enoyl-[acyl-carrier-protein] reductase n=1 Tax=Plasmopara halstedii TaxID=4781 RepID=A0A0P1B4J0_PLAHL|nr:trans-2-enoyl-reductase [Plasmopara halstedii]CEG49704.1 trans-2-enoyl-reductase [Plasmopara halstedii]|eukprot:XP_024586073.1 trans-2-enoyl-reductase [Plasmopara halstedii]
MSTIRYTEFGHPLSVLKTESDDKETAPAKHQVALKFLAAPINISDLSQIQGAYGIKPTFPAIAGNEGVAVVTAVGADVKNVKVNDRVIPTSAAFGTWRNKAVADSSQVMKISDKISIEDAATLSVNPSAAYRMLADFTTLKKGDVVVQNGANSAVGQAVIQLAALRGIKTINIIRDDGDYEITVEHLKNLGATIVCSTDYVGSAKFKELISDLPAPKLALNCVGGKTSLEMARILTRKGVHVTYGGMSKEAVAVGTGSLIFHDITLKGFWLSEWVKESTVEERAAMLSELAGLVEAGKLRTWIQTYKFADFDDALQAAVNRTTKRKIVMLME